MRFAWAQLCATQPKGGERIFAWLRTTAIREGWRLAARERRETAPAVADLEDEPTPAWEESVAAPGALEDELEGRKAAETLKGLRPRE